jgi:hypothetical protein
MLRAKVSHTAAEVLMSEAENCTPSSKEMLGIFQTTNGLNSGED